MDGVMNSQQLRLLKTDGICPISEADIRILFGEPTLEQLQTRPHTGSGYFLSTAGIVTSLVWPAEFVGRPFLRVLCQGTWRPFFGCIRDQYGHLLCWDFVGTDLVSAESVISGWEADYHALSAWHVVAFCRPDLLGKDNRGVVGHVCYAYPVHLGLRHIQIHGVPRETEPVFRCDVPPPLLFIPPPRIRAVRCLESLEEALFYLPSRTNAYPE
uniref:Uncharacterized protein n=1 Tax=Noccaea caerulescens TaxID=107243 RepID=A0A1J3K7L3_NOCCA